MTRQELTPIINQGLAEMVDLIGGRYKKLMFETMCGGRVASHILDKIEGAMVEECRTEFNKIKT